MEPLFFRNRLQVKRARWASHAAGTTADAPVPMVDGLGIGGLVEGVCEELTPPHALSAGHTGLRILDNTVIRSLDRLRQGG